MNDKSDKDTGFFNQPTCSLRISTLTGCFGTFLVVALKEIRMNRETDVRWIAEFQWTEGKSHKHRDTRRQVTKLKRSLLAELTGFLPLQLYPTLLWPESRYFRTLFKRLPRASLPVSFIPRCHVVVRGPLRSLYRLVPLFYLLFHRRHHGLP